MSRKKSVRKQLGRPWLPLVLLVAILSFGFVIAYFKDNSIVSQNYNNFDTSKPVTIFAVGDIACDPTDPNFNDNQGKGTACKHKAVVDAMKRDNADYILLLGDIQYLYGDLSAFQQSFVPVWKDIKTPMFVVPGNHDWNRGNLDGYMATFKDSFPNATYQDNGRTYYARTIGSWRIIGLDSDCEYVGGCGATSAQGKWLDDELATTTSRCTLAFWHHPRFSSGVHADLPSTTRSEYFWQTLRAARADVVLNGHDHNYERFTQQDANGAADKNGLRQFTVGSGGADFQKLADSLINNQEVAFDTKHGYLKMTLYKNTYTWQFITIDGTVADKGSDYCR